MFLTFTETDPFVNLAREKCLFDDPADDLTLVLWRNMPCLVLGRHQNPWVECNLPLACEHAVPVVRRTSGGGTVYHDEGNVNFTFIGAGDHYDLDRQFTIIVDALGNLGIDAYRNSRNDLLIGSRKISGNAFRHVRGRSLHHGTLLLSADLNDLGRFLKSDDNDAISTKAIPSVSSAVTNLADHHPGLTFETLSAAIQESFTRATGRTTNPAWKPDPSRLKSTETELRSWEWRFGKTPKFSRMINHEGGRVSVTVVKGRVESVAPETSGVPPRLSDVANDISRLLAGIRYVRRDIIERAAGVSLPAVSALALTIAESARV